MCGLEDDIFPSELSLRVLLVSMYVGEDGKWWEDGCFYIDVWLKEGFSFFFPFIFTRH